MYTGKRLKRRNMVPPIEEMKTRDLRSVRLFSSLVLDVFMEERRTAPIDDVAKKMMRAMVAIPLYMPAISGLNILLTTITSPEYKKVIKPSEVRMRML